MNRYIRMIIVVLCCFWMVVDAVSGAEPVLDLTRSDGRVEMAENLYPLLTNLTLSVWIKTSFAPQGSGNYSTVAGRSFLQGGGVSGFGIYLHNDGNVVFQARSGAAYVNAVMPYPFDGAWHHVAGVREGNVNRLYFDGELVDEVTGALASLYTAGIAFGLGMRHDGTSWAYPYTGLMADVQLWDHARTVAEVRADMFHRLEGTESGLIGYWPLDEGTAAVAADLAGSNDGTCDNAFWRTDVVLSSMLPVSVGDQGYWPFTLADIETGDIRLTDSNKVTLAEFPVPEGYDRFQITSSENASSIDPGEWVLTNDVPPEVDLTVSAGRAPLYAWFTNSVTSVSLRRSGATISYLSVEAALDLNILKSQHVVMPEDIFPGLVNLTLSVWIRTCVKPRSGTYNAIAGRGFLSSSARGFGFYLDSDGDVCFQTRDDDTAVTAKTPYPYDDNAWHHLVGVRSGTTTRLYLDGELADSATGTLASLYKAGYSFVLGARDGGSSLAYYFDGQIAEAHLWDYARSVTQIETEMFQCLSGVENGLLGYWTLTDGEGTTVVDRTDAGNDGTTGNSPLWVADAAVSVELPASRDPMRQGFWPFTLADLDSGNTRLTDSNKVAVAGFPLPDGYNVYQIQLSGDTSEIDPGGWVSTLTSPGVQDLVVEEAGGFSACHAWFTNTSENVALRRSGGSILYAPLEPALDFSAATAHVEMAPNLYPGLTNLTLSVWIKPVGVPAPGTYEALAGRGYLGLAVGGFGLYLHNNGNISFQTRDTVNYVVASAAYPYDGKWHQVAGVREGNMTRLYIDGELSDETSGALGSLYTVYIPFGLGARYAGTIWSMFYEGAMAEVRMWDRARTAEEIQKDSRYRLTGEEPGLIGYWPLDEGEGQRAYDLSANANNGVPIVTDWIFNAELLRERPPQGTVIVVY
ncbi:MAG: LamG domain-containing protein [Kiritimatiellae bacterium]|jgi:hypothetical protein|nr:LamG domain-containing protein [Kiritimatiellia bacterium]